MPNRRTLGFSPKQLRRATTAVVPGSQIFGTSTSPRDARLQRLRASVRRLASSSASAAAAADDSDSVDPRVLWQDEPAPADSPSVGKRKIWAPTDTGPGWFPGAGQAVVVLDPDNPGHDPFWSTLSEEAKAEMIKSALISGTPVSLQVTTCHFNRGRYLLSGKMSVGPASYIVGVNLLQMTMLLDPSSTTTSSGPASGLDNASGASQDDNAGGDDQAPPGTDIEAEICVDSSQDAQEAEFTADSQGSDRAIADMGVDTQSLT